VRHDHLFHSVLGLMNVHTQVYDPALDAYARCGRS
jgi:lipid A ethanolaminephosphotransferase